MLSVKSILTLGISVVVVLHLVCSSPSKPDFTPPPTISFTLYTDYSCANVLQQGSTVYCEQMLYFRLKLGLPHTIISASLEMKDAAGTQLFTASKTGILTTDSIVPLDSFKIFYPGTDTVSLRVSTADTTVDTSFTITVAGATPVIGHIDTIQTGGKKIVDSLFFLYVTVTGTPPFTYQWFRYGVEYPSGTNNDTLFFNSLAATDSGIYSCRVTSVWGSDSSLGYTLSTISSAPQILNGKTILASGIPQQLDSSFFLYVQGSGTTPLQYTWSHNGALISGTSADTLKFELPLSINDTGAYVCTLSNIWGKDVSVPFRMSFGNHPPQWKADTVYSSVYEGELLTFSFTDSCLDPDNDALTYQLVVQNPTNDTITPQGVYSFTPTFTDAGQFFVSILAGDGNVFSACVFALTVYNSNRRPVFDAQKPDLFYVINKGALLTIPFSATDADGEEISYAIGSNTLPRPETAVFSDSTITWQAYPTDSGRFALSLLATDQIDTAVAPVDIAVGNANLPPNITVAGYQSGDTMVVNEMDTLAFTISISDPNLIDVPTLTTPLNKPDSAHFDITTGLFSFTPNYKVSSAAVNYTFGTITFTVTDNATLPLTDTFILHIRVVNVNNAPLLSTINDTTIYEGDSIIFHFSVSDINGDSLYLYVDSLPGSALFVDSGNGAGLFSWTPAYTDAGIYPLTVTASDSYLLAREPVTITVRDRKFQIIAVQSDNGTISPQDTVIIEPGTDTTYTITPNTRYHIDSILVDSIKVDSDSVYTFTNVMANHTIQPFFSINIYRIILSATTRGYISDIGGTLANDTNWLPYGRAYEINATADPDYQFSNWHGTPTVEEAMSYKLKNTAKQDLTLRAEFIRNGMVKIPAMDSSFSMGQAGLAEAVHTVKFTYNLWMDETEVTQGDYKYLTTFSPSNNTGNDNLPVEQVTFCDAVLYCNLRSKVDGLDTVYTYTSKTMVGIVCATLDGFAINYDRSGYRLPTEAEWEYAYRGGTTTPYWWGTDSTAGAGLSWNAHTSGGQTQPVGHENTKNLFNLFDMGGNVWEMCNDWLDAYPAATQTNPVGAASSPQDYLVSRGGAYIAPLLMMQSAYRGFNSPNAFYEFVGFRVVRPQTNPY